MLLDHTGILGIQDILKELEKPGLDPEKPLKYLNLTRTSVNWKI